MDERERHRMTLAGEIAKLLKYRSLRDALPPIKADGTAPFIVGLPEDTVGDLTRRAESLGGDAHLLILTRLSSGKVRLRVLRLSEDSKAITDLDDRNECAVSEDSTVEMLMSHIEVGQVLSYHAYDAETVIRFINDSVQPIPA